MATDFEIPEGGIVEVRLNMEMNGQRLMNIGHFRNDVGATIVAGVDSLTYALGQMFAAAGRTTLVYKEGLASALRLEYADAQLIYPNRYAYVRRDISTDCDRAEEPLPQNVQGSYTKKVITAGRNRTGRMEVPGFTINDYSDGLWLASALDTLQLIGDEWATPLPFSALVSDTLTPIVYRRSAPLTSEEIVATEPRQTVRVARRRTVGVGQ